MKQKTITIQENEEQILELKEDLVSIIAKKNSKTIILTDAEEIQTEIHENAKVTIITLSSTKSHAKLIGNNSFQRTINLFKGQNENLEINTISEHIGKNTKSRIESKGTLIKSTANTRGLVKINEDADEADGYQKSDILILDDSKAISVPDLEIHNHNVTCSHGSTISRLSEEQIFYLMSRGLSEKDAEKIIIEGFFLSTLKELPDQIQEKIKKRFDLK